MEKLFILDSTLRDGAQGAGVNFSIEDKLNIVKILDELGVDFIEAGNPFANVGERKFFEILAGYKLKNSKIVAFGSTRRKNTQVCDDENVKSLISANTLYVSVFGKSSLYHVEKVLKASAKENLNMIKDTVNYLTKNGKKVLFDAEHFFDGYKQNSDYAMQTLKTAIESGAEFICLCDTNGGTFTDEARKITKIVTDTFKDTKIAIHCHNDNGMAVASSIAGVNMGARMIQGTLLGLGERCGNTNLSTVICNLQVKRDYECIPPENLSKLYDCSVKIADITNIAIPVNEPYIGEDAFAHKAGMHVDGVIKDSASFEHINPEIIGNNRKFLLSEISGRTTIYEKLKKYFPNLIKDSPEMDKIMKSLKDFCLKGYQFESAEASFVLNVKRILGEYTSSFDLISYKIINEQPAIEGKVASAILKIRVNGVTKISAADGEGPVHAMDLALRNALSDFYPSINKITLSDYKVRVLDGENATASKVRVLITTTSGQDSWITVGVSEDIIEASWLALTDSIDYALMNKIN